MILIPRGQKYICGTEEYTHFEQEAMALTEAVGSSHRGEPHNFKEITLSENRHVTTDGDKAPYHASSQISEGYQGETQKQAEIVIGNGSTFLRALVPFTPPSVL